MLFAHFLDSPQGKLFNLGFRPGEHGSQRRWVLVIPPFFEELNKSRRTLRLLGDALSAQGLGCLLPDLYATGDSEGEPGEATWATWVNDLTCTRSWLLEHGATGVDLLALRGGALLAWDWLAATTQEVDRLILWQPILTGKQLVNHLIRLRLAAGLTSRGSADTAASLRERLTAEGSIEIAGYRLSAALLAGIERAALGAPAPRLVGRVDWYQVIPAPDQPLPPPALQCAESWSGTGLPTQVHAVEGDAFWSTQEIVEGTPLIAATIRGYETPEDPIGD